MLGGTLGLMQAVAASGGDPYIATPAATPEAFGDAFEGGFYTGMIWNELVQTTTSTLIATGSKTFTVADMGTTPIVYAGQSLEVRSRTNPFNQMIGTVTEASGTDLTLNITGVGGSGTFSDWSVMSRYRVIVSPKASGESTSNWKNSTAAGPVECITYTEGAKATAALVLHGDATVYAMAHFCNNLVIDGFSDWYIPARDELELIYRNLKPDTTANYITADRLIGSYSYAVYGAYGTAEANQGKNNNSSPQGAAYTAGNPVQVAAGKNFRLGESEAFIVANYYSSTEHAVSSVAYLVSNSGRQNTSGGKTTVRSFRAIRRSII